MIVGTCGFSSGISPTQNFVRKPDGTIFTFSVPTSILTDARAVNDHGEIVGEYRDNGPFNRTHAFIRMPDGTITTFDGPGAASTQAFNLNSSGTVVGAYTDSANIIHGFVRDAAGTLTPFDGSGTSTLGGLALHGEDFYGVTSLGGANGFGSVFQWRVLDAYRVLYNFKGASDGANPIATPVTTYDFAHIYGTTTSGGDDACSCGTLFRIFFNGEGGANENVVLRMKGSPAIGLSYDQMFNISDPSDGPYYGATVTGGTSNNGAIYRFVP